MSVDDAGPLTRVPMTFETVDQIGLAVGDGEEGIDHSGATMPSWAVEDVAFRDDPHGRRRQGRPLLWQIPAR
ncbi:MAG: hypothetical protein ABR583_07615 [Gaiellaceae bacterium]